MCSFFNTLFPVDFVSHCEKAKKFSRARHRPDDALIPHPFCGTVGLSMYSGQLIV